MFPDCSVAIPYYKYFRTWHVTPLSCTVNAIEKTINAMRLGSSLFTIASARAFPPVTSLESGVDVNPISSARSITIWTLTRKFLDSISTVWLCFRYLKEHESSGLLIFRLSVIETKLA